MVLVSAEQALLIAAGVAVGFVLAIPFKFFGEKDGLDENAGPWKRFLNYPNYLRAQWRDQGNYVAGATDAHAALTSDPALAMHEQAVYVKNAVTDAGNAVKGVLQSE